MAVKKPLHGKINASYSHISEDVMIITQNFKIFVSFRDINVFVLFNGISVKVATKKVRRKIGK